MKKPIPEAPAGRRIDTDRRGAPARTAVGDPLGEPPATSDPEVLRAGPLEIRPGELAAVALGRRLTLTVRELQLLTALARRAGRVVPRAELYASVWGSALPDGDRSVDVYVSKLRTKLEGALPSWRYIHTHFGFGYRFSPEPLHDFHRSSTKR